MKLEAWRISKDMTYDALGDFLGVDKSTAHRWCSGKRKPRPEEAFRIVDATGGEVSLAEVYQADAAVPESDASADQESEAAA